MVIEGDHHRTTAQCAVGIRDHTAATEGTRVLHRAGGIEDASARQVCLLNDDCNGEDGAQPLEVAEVVLTDQGGGVGARVHRRWGW